MLDKEKITETIKTAVTDKEKQQEIINKAKEIVQREDIKEKGAQLLNKFKQEHEKK